MRIFEKKRYVFLFLFVSGVVTALTECLPQIGIFEWISMVPLALAIYGLALREENGKKVNFAAWYFYGFFYMMSHFLVIYHWFFSMYPLDFVGLDGSGSMIVIIVAWIGLSLLAAILGALVFLIAGLFLRGKTHDRKHGLIFPFLFAALMTLSEFVLTIGWTGVPWGRLSLGQVKMLPVIQSVSLFGCYFITFLLVSVNFLIGYAILNIILASGEGKKLSLAGMWKENCVRVPVIIMLTIIVINTAFGFVRLSIPRESDAEKVKIAAIQGNISSKEKWDENSNQKMMDVYREYTLKAAADGAQIVIWPETAFPYHIFSNQNSYYKYFISNLAKESETTIFVGCLYSENGNEYNSIAVCLPDGTFLDEIYSKRHLVPFGEYVPMKEIITALIPELGEVSMSDDLTPGESTSIFTLNEGNFGSIICFDSIYEELTRDSVNDGAQIIVLSTNDSWFYDSAAVYMHNNQSVLRALETGKYVVRAANTGISSIITDRGEVIDSLEPLVEGYIVDYVEMIDGKTFYDIIGNTFVYLCAAFALATVAFDVAMKVKKRG